jgi:hypothetical protein
MTFTPLASFVHSNTSCGIRIEVFTTTYLLRLHRLGRPPDIARTEHRHQQRLDGKECKEPRRQQFTTIFEALQAAMLVLKDCHSLTPYAEIV